MAKPSGAVPALIPAAPIFRLPRRAATTLPRSAATWSFARSLWFWSPRSSAPAKPAVSPATKTPSSILTSVSGITAIMKGAPRHRSRPNARHGRFGPMAYPTAKPPPRWPPAPRERSPARWLLVAIPRAMSRSSPTATSCASWPPAGSACRPKTAAFSPWAQPPFPPSATNARRASSSVGIFRFRHNQADPQWLCARLHLHHLGHQLQRVHRRNHPRQIALRIVSAQHRHLRRRQKNLHHAQLLSRVGEPHHQLFIVLERLLQAVNLPEDDGAHILRRRQSRRGCGRILGDRKERLLGQLLGKIDERHLL